MRGHFQYYGISGNSAKIVEFYRMTTKLVHKWFNRRSQKGKMNWDEFTEYLKHYPLPRPRIVHKFTLSGVRGVKLKSRMWEIHKSGSVSGIEVLFARFEYCDTPQTEREETTGNTK